MTTTNQQPIKQKQRQRTCKQAIILMKSKSFKEDILLKEEILKLAAKHNLSVIKVIKSNKEYDADMLDELVETVKEQKEPVAIIAEDCKYLLSVNILGCCVIGTLVKSGLAELCSYSRLKNGNLSLHYLQTNKTRFLQIAKIHLWKLIN